MNPDPQLLALTFMRTVSRLLISFTSCQLPALWIGFLYCGSRRRRAQPTDLQAMRKELQVWSSHQMGRCWLQLLMITLLGYGFLACEYNWAMLGMCFIIVSTGGFTQVSFSSHMPGLWQKQRLGATSSTVLYCITLLFSEYSVVSKEKYYNSEVTISCV